MSASRTLRVGVVGCGHLGSYHAQKYRASDGVALVAVIDTDRAAATRLGARLGVPSSCDHRGWLERVDAVSITAPTTLHCALASDFLAAGVHVLVEKPIATNLAQADAMIALARRHRCVLQVGHMQRFHPALDGLRARLHAPTFIEAHRLAPFTPRGSDVDVVLDLMIHDLDIIFSLVDAELSHIDAAGACVLSDAIDIANVRCNFANGCVANITASRVSQKTQRKVRVFQKSAYLVADLYEHRLEEYSRTDDFPAAPTTPATALTATQGSSAEPTEAIACSAHDYEDSDALKRQIDAFIHSIRTAQRPLVAGEDGRRALAIALQISELIHHRLDVR